MEITLNSELLNRGIFTGIYQTQIGELYILDKYYEDFDKHIMQTYKEIMEEALTDQDIPCVISPIRIDKPRFYNYSDNCVVFEIKLPDDFSSRLKDALCDIDFMEFLNEEYKSYNGFVSFMPNTKDKFEEFIEDDIERATSAFINFTVKSNTDVLQSEFIDRVIDKAYDYGWVVYEEDEEC